MARALLPAMAQSDNGNNRMYKMLLIFPLSRFAHYIKLKAAYFNAHVNYVLKRILKSID